MVAIDGKELMVHPFLIEAPHCCGVHAATLSGDNEGFYRASWWGVVSVLEMVFEFNHKIMINVQESPPSIMVTRKPMVCERLDKGLVVQGENVSPPVHTT